jgi:Holliday junction resolvasome RuvABC endonuclease subunit
MSFLGVDPSLTGFSYHHGVPDGHYYRFGIRTKLKDFESFPARLDFMTMQFRRFLIQHGGTVSLAAIEGFSMGSKGKSAKSIEIGAVGMMARVELWRRGIPFLEVPPSTLKKWISGHGNAEKSQMVKEVLKRWGYDAEDDDAADSYALVRLAERWVNPIAETTKKDELLWSQVQKACTRIEGRYGDLSKPA